MADEVEILTTNEAGDSWVDVEPGAVSTGYQNQNTNIEAQRIGIDESTLTWDGGTSELVLAISGVMDENGLPFVVKSEVRLTIASNNTWYIRLIAGSTTDKRSVQLTTSPGTWDSALNGYYISGDRVLNWVIIKGTAATPEIYRRMNDDSGAGLSIENIITDSIKTDLIEEKTAANGVDIEDITLKAGIIDAPGGRVPAGSYSKTGTVTENDIFDGLDSAIPNNGDSLITSGGWNIGGADSTGVMIHKMVRTSSTVITLHTSLGATQTVTNGSGTTFSSNGFGLSW